MILALAGWLVGYTLGRWGWLREVRTLLLAAAVGAGGLVIGGIEALAYSGFDYSWLAAAVIGPIGVWSGRRTAARREALIERAGAPRKAAARRR